MNAINALSFEQAYQELEQAIARLESGELPLEDSLALYEKGRLLAAHCQKLLDNAELRIKRIDDSGNISSNL